MIEKIRAIKCKKCYYSTWYQEPEHGKIIYYCKKLEKEVNKYFSCDYGKEKKNNE